MTRLFLYTDEPVLVKGLETILVPSPDLNCPPSVAAR